MTKKTSKVYMIWSMVNGNMYDKSQKKYEDIHEQEHDTDNVTIKDHEQEHDTGSIRETQ